MGSSVCTATYSTVFSSSQAAPQLTSFLAISYSHFLLGPGTVPKVITSKAGTPPSRNTLSEPVSQAAPLKLLFFLSTMMMQRAGVYPWEKALW